MEKLMVKTKIALRHSKKINFSIRISIFYSLKHCKKVGIERKSIFLHFEVNLGYYLIIIRKHEPISPFPGELGLHQYSRQPVRKWFFPWFGAPFTNFFLTLELIYFAFLL